MLLIGLAKPKLVCANRQSSKSPPAEGSLASPDASPGIATWRSQPCVRRCSFGALRLILAISVDGGPLTDNVVLNSAQRVFVPKRSAVPRPRIGTGLVEGETGQAKPDWPPKVTGFQIASCRRQPCVRRCSFGALRLIPLFPILFSENHSTAK